jgi:hypothetical protein
MAYSDNFKVWGPYIRKEDGRQIVIVLEKDGTKRTVSYPKWLMECHLGRRLDPNEETVDHIDSNFDNNDLDNLRLMPRKEHSADDTRRVKNLKFNCAGCKNEFERSPRLIRDKSNKGKAGPFCSRSCAGKYSRQLQLKLIEKMVPQPFVESEYFKQKYVEASAQYTEDEIDIEFEDMVAFASESNDVNHSDSFWVEVMLHRFLKGIGQN